jgi:PPOX class probable FMN-dependent enzyme
MEFVTTRDELRTIYKTPRPTDGSIRKELKALDGHCRSFIGKSPFVLIGSSDGAGNADVTPKGDRPGFAAVLDDQTIAIPDRPGNNRLDTLENIVVNPAVGLLFLIPGMNETLRVNGEARITTDAALRERLAVEGKPPQSVVIVTVKAAYMHCAKAFMRSELWKPESWPDRASMPTLGEILRDQLAVDQSAAETDRRLDEAYKQTLW